MARVLVVDDEDRVRRMLRTALEREGHEVLEAREGNEALRMQQASPAELVITDLIMPDKDGLEVIMALRRDAPGLKIIAMSGGGRFSAMESLQMAEPLGAFAALRKPFQLDVMMETVRKALAA